MQHQLHMYINYKTGKTRTAVILTLNKLNSVEELLNFVVIYIIFFLKLSYILQKINKI